VRRHSLVHSPQRPPSSEHHEHAEQCHHDAPGDTVHGQPAIALRGPAEQREGSDHRHRIEKTLDRENRRPLRGADGGIHAMRDHWLESSGKQLADAQSQQHNEYRGASSSRPVPAMAPVAAALQNRKERRLAKRRVARR
jgi:hypothetical protein